MRDETTRVATKTADGRDAYLVPSDDAGSYRTQVAFPDPWHVMLHRGVLTQTECDAAQAHADAWHATGWVREMRCGYEPSASGDRIDIADQMGEPQMVAWRAFQGAQRAMPVSCRGLVYNLVAWRVWPADHRLLKIGLRALANVYGLC